jgi:hypothetical protein
MSAIIHEYASRKIEPARSSVLQLLGYPDSTELRSEVEDMLDRAFELFLDSADPVGISEAIAFEAFDAIFPGESLNAAETPLETIYPRADSLALYAVTIGPGISGHISRLFDENDFAFATILDAVASMGADRLAEKVTLSHRAQTTLLGTDSTGTATLGYSPGYCGWHVSAQRALFAALQPERIGIELLESCLMQPTKSVSGVIVTGPADIHRFASNYPFCAECATKSCHERIAALDGVDV